MGILEKIAEIEREISRTQKNKGKSGLAWSEAQFTARVRNTGVILDTRVRRPCSRVPVHTTRYGPTQVVCTKHPCRRAVIDDDGPLFFIMYTIPLSGPPSQYSHLPFSEPPPLCRRHPTIFLILPAQLRLKHCQKMPFNKSLPEARVFKEFNCKRLGNGCC